jgi:hypothetical protein
MALEHGENSLIDTEKECHSRNYSKTVLEHHCHKSQAALTMNVAMTKWLNWQLLQSI